MKKETKAIDDRIITDTWNISEQQEENYKPVRVGCFYSNNYIEYESNGHRSKTLSIKEYLEKIKLYLKTSERVLKNLIHGKFDEQ